MIQRPRISTQNPRSAVVSRAVGAPAVPRRYLTLPNISYSTSVVDINPYQLQQLYRCISSQSSPSQASVIHKGFFQHWEYIADNEALEKVQLLLDNSVAVAAAFVRDPQLQQADCLSSATSTSSSSSLSAGSSWHPFAWKQRLPRRLVGFVRAAGDRALVATVHDLIIHPDLQGFGLGSVLLRKLVARIAEDGVYDVGTVTPRSLQPFFHTCSFDLDRESSVPMALHPNKVPASAGEINAPLQDNRALVALLQSANGNLLI